MSSALQLTDTDFAKAFKDLVRQKMDQLRFEGVKDVWQPGLEAMLEAMVAGQEEMRKRNSENQWVLAGMRRNGFLVLRPKTEGFALAEEEEWAENMPVGSSRLSGQWLEQRLDHWKGGKEVEKPNWKKVAGAAEVADLQEFEAFGDFDKQEDVVLSLEAGELQNPEWAVAAGFQLSLDLRKADWMRRAQEEATED